MITALFAVVFIQQLRELVDWLAPYLAIPDNDDAMRLALFHTIFNVAGVLLVVPFLKPLVNFLETLFHDEAKRRGRAKYLTYEVMEIPAAALAALRKETIHLYDKSLEAIVHAMNLHRTQIFSDADIDEVIERSAKLINIDVDEVYQSEIKQLYGEILEYASMSQSYMDPQGNREIYELKLTARKIIEMVKDVRELQKNLNFYSKSRNLDLIEKYNKLRVRLIWILRMIQELREFEGDEEEILTRIELEKVNAEEWEITMNHEVDALIRGQKIDSHSASSLINDIGFTQSISKKLLSSAVNLWVRDEEIKGLGDEYGYS
jgi:phosphate:Na+ symporter